MIADLQDVLFKLHKDLHDLRDRKARGAGPAAPELLNEIDDHLTTIRRIQQLRLGTLSLREDLDSLNIDPELKARLLSILRGK